LVLDPYEVLGIARDATLEEAKAAYRRLAQLFHPDRLQGLQSAVQAEGARRMQEATEAIRAVNARFGRPLRAPGHGPRGHGESDRRSTKVAERPATRVAPGDEDAKLYDIELESMDGPHLHVRWGGPCAAATLAAVRSAHRSRAASVRQVEWGSYEMVLSGNEMRHFLRTVVPGGCEGEVATLVAAEAGIRARLSEESRGPIGLTCVLDALDGRAHYALVADLY
jgi:curved DNA-binding protein CbpA